MNGSPRTGRHEGLHRCWGHRLAEALSILPLCEQWHIGLFLASAYGSHPLENRLMLGSGVDDVLPMTQGPSEICSLAGFDQVVADAGKQRVGDLLP